jgi:hypothetical protein
MFTIRTTPTESKAEPAPSKRANAKSLDIASPPVPDKLAALHVKPDTGLTQGELNVRRTEHDHNEDHEVYGTACRSDCIVGPRSMLRQLRDRIDRTSTVMHISPKLQVARLAHS